MPYLFRPPTRQWGPAGLGHRLWMYYKLNHGVAVLVTDGVVAEHLDPTPDQIDAADITYLGGHDYYVSGAEAAVLSAGGLSACLTKADVYLDNYEDTY